MRLARSAAFRRLLHWLGVLFAASSFVLLSVAPAAAQTGSDVRRPHLPETAAKPRAAAQNLGAPDSQHPFAPGWDFQRRAKKRQFVMAITPALMCPCIQLYQGISGSCTGGTPCPLLALSLVWSSSA
jgi:hypothetical protein